MNTMGKKRKGNALAAQPLPSQNAMITGTIAPADPTIAMRFGEAVTPWFDAAKSVFPESNPHGQALKNFLLGSAPESAERMAQGYTNVLGNFRGDNPLNYNLNQNALDMAGALPIGAAADTAVKLGALGKMGLGAKEALIAFHGSPHRFPPMRELQMPDGTRLIQNLHESNVLPEGAKIIAEHPFGRFSLSKIGTGEGAQSYGHGLYFAENPGVAKGYADTLGKRHQASGSLTEAMEKVTFNGRPLLSQFDVDHTEDIVDLARSKNVRGLDDLAREKRARWEEMAADESYPFRDYAVQKRDAYSSLVNEIGKGGELDFPGGNLYHVDIPDDQIDKMLDWDKPLSKQPEALRALGYDAKTAAAEFGKDATGQTLANKIAGRKPRAFSVRGADGHFMKSEAKTYDEAVQLAGGNQKNVLILNKPEIASQIMKEAGIPGIKYLDAGSRGAGNGTRNFVVFDDQIPKILKRE